MMFLKLLNNEIFTLDALQYPKNCNVYYVFFLHLNLILLFNMKSIELISATFLVGKASTHD